VKPPFTATSDDLTALLVARLTQLMGEAGMRANALSLLSGASPASISRLLHLQTSFPTERWIVFMRSLGREPGAELTFALTDPDVASRANLLREKAEAEEALREIKQRLKGGTT
jgi:hypothetical protein